MWRDSGFVRTTVYLPVFLLDTHWCVSGILTPSNLCIRVLTYQRISNVPAYLTHSSPPDPSGWPNLWNRMLNPGAHPEWGRVRGAACLDNDLGTLFAQLLSWSRKISLPPHGGVVTENLCWGVCFKVLVLILSNPQTQALFCALLPRPTPTIQQASNIWSRVQPESPSPIPDHS